MSVKAFFVRIFRPLFRTLGLWQPPRMTLPEVQAFKNRLLSESLDRLQEKARDAGQQRG